MMSLRKINKWVLLTITIALLVLAGGLIYLATKVGSNTFLLISTVIVFFMFTISMNAFISKVVVFKPKKINYPTKEYNYQSASQIKEHLVANGFEETKTKFGSGFIKIVGKTAYKVVIVEDETKYFDQPEEKKKERPTKGIEKCTEFVGFEIFSNSTEEIKTKTPLFSFSGANVLYEGFYLDEQNQKIVEANSLSDKTHEKSYFNLIQYINLIEIQKELQK